MPGIGPVQPITASDPQPLADGAGETGSAGEGGGFGSLLAKQLDKLDRLQQSADGQTQALATGKATDVASVVMEVERASLALQLAVQVRDKAVDAYHEIFRMQI
jgi:flagellar hook-basal body complex protein FliE